MLYFDQALLLKFTCVREQIKENLLEPPLIDHEPVIQQNVFGTLWLDFQILIL